jgi:Tfp pilus assembly protein PilP
VRIIIIASFFVIFFSGALYASDWPPHALEAYDLKSLRVCRVILNKDLRYVIIKDSNGYVHRAFLGDMLGKDYGAIREISEKGIRLEEVIKTKDGEWVSRYVELKYEKCSVNMPEIRCSSK